ncbi:blue copper protein [Quercus suber]|uniref:Blue copper protein n=1 Tax=Quercus suber TaxID=58331 RepID=A0AAW0LYU5_QUESU
MKETKFFKYWRLLIILMINFLFLNGARSEIYTVGDEEEWNADADFVSWSQKYKLSVGDVLRFTYVKGQHNAYEVTEDTYRSCNVSSGVLAKYESGNDQIKLKQAKKYWFICNVPGHCLGGMRFSIDVKEASATSGANSTSATITPPTESSSPLNSCKSFTYVKGQHNTYEVTEDTYRSCNVSSGVLAKYESGNDQIKLKQAKKYWFICNVPGHCLGGMRFSIDVKEASATSGANSTRATITPPTESSSPLNSCKIHAPVRWSMGINLMAFGILIS